MSYLKVPTGMSKSESLEFLKSNGFNTIDYSICTDLVQIKSFIESRTMGKDGFSIRTEHSGVDNKKSFKFPFYMGMKVIDRVLEVAELLLSQGYTLIISQTLDPADTICKGTAVIHPADNVMLEYLLGPGTVRQLEEQTPNVDNLFIFDNPKGHQWKRSIFNFMMDKLATADIIVEWSYYPYPVGLLKEQLILWELRPWK